MISLPYKVLHGSTEVAEAETFSGALCALRTLRYEYPEPQKLHAQRKGQDVAFILPDGVGIGMFQGSERW